MDFYQTLGAVSIGLLALSLALSAYVLQGNISKKMTTVIAFTVLGLMLTVSGLCTVIYSEYGGARISSK